MASAVNHRSDKNSRFGGPGREGLARSARGFDCPWRPAHDRCYPVAHAPGVPRTSQAGPHLEAVVSRAGGPWLTARSRPSPPRKARRGSAGESDRRSVVAVIADLASRVRPALATAQVVTKAQKKPRQDLAADHPTGVTTAVNEP